jgi:hypothetical protein
LGGVALADEQVAVEQHLGELAQLEARMDGARVVTFAVMEPLGIEQLLFVGGEVERLVDVLLRDS